MRGVRSQAWLGAALLALTFLAAPAARAESRCGPRLQTWLAACARQHAVSLTPLDCPDGHWLIELRASPTPLKVDVVQGPGGMLRAGAFGLSPVLDDAQWRARESVELPALQGLASCFATQSPPAEARPAATADPQHPHAAPPVVPHLLLAGLALGLLAALLARRHAAASSARPLAASLAAAILASVATWLLRRWLFPAAFVHQNGHGALWTRDALGEAARYGPGYRELFSHAARWLPDDPEAGLFAAQGALAAVEPYAAWTVTRAAGATPPLALLAALAVALDPVLGRLANSESYFGTGAALAFVAAALWVRAMRWPRLPAALGFAAAGCLIAQVARVHPLCWLPLALLPLSALPQAPEPTLPDVRVQFWRRTALGLGVVLAVLALTSGRELLAVLTSPQHESFRNADGILGMFPLLVQHPLRLALVPLALLVLLFALRRPRLHPYGVAVLLAGLMQFQPRVAVPELVNQAMVVAFAPPWLAVFAAWLSVPGVWRSVPVTPLAAAGTSSWRAPDRRQRTALLLGAVLVALWLASRWHLGQFVATDAAEAELWREHRRDLRDHDVLAMLSRAADPRVAIVIQPLYPGLLPAHRFRVLPDLKLDPQLAVPADGRVLYYRSSLCATREGAPACAAFERTQHLQPLWQQTLAPRPGGDGSHYLPGDVHIGLFAVAQDAAPPSQERK